MKAHKAPQQQKNGFSYGILLCLIFNFFLFHKTFISSTGLDFSEDAQENSRQFVHYFLTRVVQRKTLYVLDSDGINIATYVCKTQIYLTSSGKLVPPT